MQKQSSNVNGIEMAVLTNWGFLMEYVFRFGL